MQSIDVAHIVREKAKGKWIPDFVVRYLQRIVHEKEMNAFLAVHGEKTNFDFIETYLTEGLHCDYSVENADSLPQGDEPLLFVSNHPLGGLDGIIIALLLHKHRERPIRVIVNDLLLNLTPIKDLFVPVNKVGAQSREYARLQRELWQSTDDILSFPAGACSRKQQGVIRDLEWKPTFIRRAVETHRDIIPIYFEGKNSPFFYNLALWRKRLGIRTNIEMMYLADEMYKACGKHFVVHIGERIPYTTFDNTHTAQEWANYVYGKIYDYERDHSTC